MIDEQNKKKMIDYERCIAPIFRFILLRIKNYHEAEDLTQTVFLKAWKGLPKYEEKNQFLSWLYAIARNTIVDYWKKKKEFVFDSEKTDILEDCQDFLETLQEEEDFKGIINAIDLLSEDQQEIIILKFIEDLPNREISEIMERSEEAIRQLQVRAIKSLKAHLDKNYG